MAWILDGDDKPPIKNGASCSVAYLLVVIEKSAESFANSTMIRVGWNDWLSDVMLQWFFDSLIAFMIPHKG